MAVTKKQKLNMLWIPEKNDPIWIRLYRDRRNYLHNELGVTKLKTYKNSGIFYFLECSPKVLKALLAINNVIMQPQLINKIAVDNLKNNIQMAKTGSNRTEFPYVMLYNYATALGHQSIFTVHDVKQSAHLRCKAFVAYCKKFGVPKNKSDNQTERYWANYLSKLIAYYKYKRGRIYCDNMMLSMLKRSPAWIRFTRDLESMAVVKCQKLLQFVETNGIPTIRTSPVLHNYLRTQIRTYRHNEFIFNSVLCLLQSNVAVWSCFTDYAIIKRLKRVFIKYPYISDLSKLTRKLDPCNYDLLFRNRLKKSSNTMLQRNKLLYDHYGIKNFLSYSYKEIREMAQKAKLKEEQEKRNERSKKRKSREKRKSAKVA